MINSNTIPVKQPMTEIVPDIISRRAKEKQQLTRALKILKNK